MKTCYDCGCKEGELHDFGCDMEECPFCGRQLITCGCCYDLLKLRNEKKYTEETGFLPPNIHENGLSDGLKELWWRMLEEKGRIPYIVYPNICSRCGKLWPWMFRVNDNEWNKYVRPSQRSSILCKRCYEEIKALIDEAEWRDNGI